MTLPLSSGLKRAIFVTCFALQFTGCDLVRGWFAVERQRDPNRYQAAVKVEPRELSEEYSHYFVKPWRTAPRVTKQKGKKGCHKITPQLLRRLQARFQCTRASEPELKGMVSCNNELFVMRKKLGRARIKELHLVKSIYQCASLREYLVDHPKK